MNKLKNGIQGVVVTPLKKISVDGGDVLRGMKKRDAGYAGFGEAYFSIIYSNAIKAWKLHKKMTLNLIVPVGKIKFIIYDNRDKALGHGNYQEVILGKDNYARLTIPPMVWVGFQGFSDAKSMLLNIADIEHSKEEVLRLDQHEIDYKWRNFI